MNGLTVDFDALAGAPRLISAGAGFLSGPQGSGGAISAQTASAFTNSANGPTKAFLAEHRNLFGFGPEALDAASVQRDYVAANNGLHTVVWAQQVAGVGVFEAVLMSHTTKNGELVNIASQFVPDPATAAAASPATRNITARQALALAARNIGTELADGQITAEDSAVAGAEERQQFKAPGLKGSAEAKLVWLPMNKQDMRLCWSVQLMSRARGEMFLLLVDAQTGEILVRHGLTNYISDATYRVYTSDSPSPFSPGDPTPSGFQPPLIPRVLVTTNAFNTTASPNGWIDDGVNETLGNNVDAHTDRDGSPNVPDLPRPTGSPFRVFDFPMTLATQDPTNYSAAAVVQLFYLCNWYHDKMYEFGFTEAAGNFQLNNFGRGGAQNDPVQADAQDGSGVNNANFSTPSDGASGRMQMYIFTGPSPRRDGDLDAEIVFHEHTHGLSNRRVGGGVGISQLQPGGMGEGWSDFYALCLLSQPADDANGVYAMGGYATFQLAVGFTQNYYFGIRRYPYSTDLLKNPLTFKDIDPAQISSHAGVPKSTVIGGAANEVHNLGEMWCVTLWEARANLIAKYGSTAGNQRILQLVTDGMGLAPGNPTFLQARNAILQADTVDYAGADLPELWAAFAKRGMGFNATVPANTTTAGTVEDFSVPDSLRITPSAGFTAIGPVGGPFSPNTITYSLTNISAATFSWSLSTTSAWLTVGPTSGSLAPGGAATSVIASLNAAANGLPMGNYATTVVFSNQTSHITQTRAFTLRVGQIDYFTELFTGAGSSTNDLSFRTITLTPNGGPNFYAVCGAPAVAFPTDPTGGTTVALTDDSSSPVTLSGANTVAIYNRRTNVFFISSNGYLTMNSGDTTFTESTAQHFNLPRVSALFDDLNPALGGSVSWRELGDRVAVTYSGIHEYLVTTVSNSFQIELFFDGRIRLTWLGITALDGLAGISAGLGLPADYAPSDLSTYTCCVAPTITTQPTDQTVQLNGTATFTVSASGTTPSYAWRRNGSPIAGATASSYSLLNAALADSGALFSCSVTNSCGVALSASARLTVSTNLSYRYAVLGAPAADSWNDDVLAKIRASLPFSQVDGFLVGGAAPVPTLLQLQPYRAVLVYSDSGFNNPAALGDVLANYSDNGGGVVVGVFANSSGLELQGRLVAGGYLPTTIGAQTGAASLTLAADLPAHPLLNAVSSFNGGASGYHASGSTLTAGAIQVAHWSNGQPLVTTKQLTAGKVVALNFYPPSSDARSDFWTASTDGGRLMANALLYSANVRVSVAYVRSSVGLPWNLSDNEAAMNAVFGLLAWQDLRFETLNVPALLSPANQFIFMEGADLGAIEMATFVTNNLAAIQNWVAAGGSLFMNLAPNEGGTLFYPGFGTLVTNQDFTPNAGASNPSHPIFIGPATPVGAVFAGGYFGHATVSGSGLSPLITNSANGRLVLAEKGYGLGHLMVGGLTLPGFQSPQPNATNLLVNILSYGASLPAAVSNLTISSADRGWYDLTGFHNPANSNYYAGHQGTAPANNANNWFVFNIPAFPGTIGAADLLIKTYGVSTPSLFETYVLRDVTTPIPQLIAGGSGLTGIYADLANGVVYGDRDIFATESSQTVVVPLNAAFINAATAARAAQIALGGSFTFDVPAGNEYLFGASGFTADDVQLRLTFASANPPAIVSQPLSQSAPLGGVANFSVAASGAGPLSYQWRKNGANLGGATATTLSLSGIIASDAANYDVVVTNVFGAVTSSLAALTISSPATVLSNANLVVTLDNLGGRISSILYRGSEIVRVGDFISDWGLQTGTNAATFVRNENIGNTSGQPMALLATNPFLAAYSGVYTSGGANVTARRSYVLVPGSDLLRVTQTFSNNGPFSITLRTFDTYDPDLLLGGLNYYYSAMDRYVIATNGNSIQMGSGIISNGPLVAILGTADPAAIVSAATAAYFGISASPALNTFFSTGGADANGAILDNTLDVGREMYLPPGAGASLVFYESFATNVPQAELAIINDVLGRAYFLPGSATRVGSQFQAILAGPGAAYELQGSSNLVNWQVIGTIPMSNGTGPVIDNNAAASRFYRARLLP